MTPYGSVFWSVPVWYDYQLSNDTKVDGQSYDSMRYELGVDAGYTFTCSEDQALTPVLSKLAYVYDDSNNDNDVNGDSPSITVPKVCGTCWSGYSVQPHPRTSAPTDANYLGGGDVDQDWSANVGIKITW